MRKIFTLSLFLFFTFFISAQESVVYKFYGNLVTSSGYKIPFYLKIINPKSGNYTGYTITNYGKDDQTKSSVKGKIDVTQNTISFHETGNLDTKSSADASSFCYIHAKNLKLTIKEKSSVISGTFEGLFPSGEKCATGKVMLVSTDKIKPKDEKIEQPTTEKVKSDTALKANTKQNLKTELPDSIFKANEILNVKNDKGPIVLQLWDGDMLDHDEVAIYVNNKLLQSKVLLQRNKQTFTIPHSQGVVEIKILALNQGTSDKNSLNFRFKDLNDNKVYKSELSTNEFFKIKISK